MYNQELAYVAKAEEEGRCLVIRPDDWIPIGHISHDPHEMHGVYELGRKVGERYIEQIKDFYKI
jgi:predicted patatin/cPLA2 family phospholipase